MTLRRATADDAAALTRLRVQMYESWQEDAGGEEWRDASTAMFRRRIAEEPDDFVAYVVEVDGRVVSSGVGWLSTHLPNPRNLSGRRGHIASMSTEPAHRRRGYARQVITALVEWFAERGIVRIDLVATAEGEPLYRSVGFAEHQDAQALVWRGEPAD